MEKPRKRTSVSIFSNTGMFKKDNFYLADEMDTYLAQKDKEIGELVEALERVSIPLCGSPSEWGKKELADIINTKAELAKSALNKHKTIKGE